ncbi:hypothetical protein FACS1894125_3850 [Actinomycetota bacterium]|nr:hypothetical protein FACS1894125_3850 [Actinomycetota bacterium]
MSNFIKTLSRVLQPYGKFCLSVLPFSFFGATVLHWQWAIFILLVVSISIAQGVVFIATTRKFAVEFLLPKNQIVVESNKVATLKVANSGRRTISSTTIQMIAGDELINLRIKRLKHKEEIQLQVKLNTTKRQVVEVLGLKLIRNDPLMVFQLQKTVTPPSKYYVHPKTYPIDVKLTGSVHDLDGIDSDILTSSDLVFSGLRDYVETDSMKNIHWKSSAKLGKLVTKQYNETRKSKTVIVLDTSGAKYDNNEDFEREVGHFSSIGVELLKNKADAEFLTSAGIVLNNANVRCFLNDISGVKLDEGVL